MRTKTVKISDEHYRALCGVAGDLQKELGKPISVDRALTSLIRRKKLSELAGVWSMTDEEAKNMMHSLRKGWSDWKVTSSPP